MVRSRPNAVLAAPLSAACREYLDGKVFDASGTGGTQFEVFRYLMWRQGVVDAEFLPYRGRFESEARAKALLGGIVAQLLAVRFNRYGLAVQTDAKGRVDLAIVVDEREIALAPIAREQVPGAVADLRLTAVAGSKPLRAFVQRPDGRTVEVVPDAAESLPEAGKPVDTRVRVPLETAGRYEVEIVFADDAGPRITASFPLFAGVAFPPRHAAIKDPIEAGKITDAAAETKLATLINAARQRYGLRPLEIEPRLTRIAREHTAAMKKAGFGRPSSGTAPLSDRLDHEGVLFRDAVEVMGLGASASTIQRTLLSSPTHRLALLDARLTHLGLGIATGGSGASAALHATLVLSQLVPKVDPLQAQARILAGINSRRAALGAPALAVDAPLAGVAALHAAAMARAGKPAYEVGAGDWKSSLFDKAKPAAKGAKALGGFVGVLSDAADPIEFDGAVDPAMLRAGIGLVQANSEEYGRGALWVVVLVAR